MEKKETYSRYMTCADISFEIRSQWPITNETFHKRLMPFQTASPQKDNVRIEHIFSIPAYLKELSNEKAIDKQTLWTVFKKETNWIYKKEPASPVSNTNAIFMESSQDFSINKIYCNCLSREQYALGRYNSTTIFGCDQIIMTKLLSTRKGALFHANGFIANNLGYLLAGPSTAGKTTLSKMLNQNNFINFSDDRAIIRFKNDQWRLQGSWFHGSTPLTSTGSHVIAGIFFLEHAKENTICPIPSSRDKLGPILQSIVRPHITVKEWKFMLDTIGKMAEEIPCYQLRFDLSGDIVSQIKKITT